jgi:GDPmannose 4,6-dehydratase
VQNSVRECVNIAAKEIGFDILWIGNGVDEKGYDKDTKKQIISVDRRYYRPADVETLLGDCSKAKEKLGWEPKISFEEMIKEMVSFDLEEAKKEKLCIENGFSTRSHFACVN